MSFVKIENITKRFGDTVASNNVSFNVEEGEFVSILGPSGSGKTTMLNIIAGFEDPDTGAVIMDGQNILDYPPEDRDMSMVFQRLALFPHLSVFDNIAFGLKMKEGASSDMIEEKVLEALELMSLSGYEDRDIQSLSGGEQQRVALARALVMEPNLLLYDEPLSDLDRQLREQMRREIKKIHDRLGITSIYVTHNQREALTLSNRILVLHEGEMVVFGSPGEIYQDPPSKFVADFLGDSNFIPGTVRTESSGTVFECDDFSVPLTDNIDKTGSAMMYIRPEDIVIGASEQSNGQSFTGEVKDTVHLGSTTEYTIEIFGNEFISTSLGPPDYSTGEKVTITFNDYGVLHQ